MCRQLSSCKQSLDATAPRVTFHEGQSGLHRVSSPYHRSAVMLLARLLFTANARFSSPDYGRIRSLLGSLIFSSSRSLHSSHHHHFVLRLHRNVSLPQLHQATSLVHTSSVFSSDGVSKPEESPVSDRSSSIGDDLSTPATTPRLALSDRCRARLQTVLDPDEILRIGVRGGGCSGFEYEFSVEKASTVNPSEDLFFEEKVVVDRESIDYMKGAQLDFEEELIRSGFRIVNNPLAEKGCSCGASFSLKF